jgi:hypothetical protein
VDERDPAPPALIALGIGLAVNNARAVIEAILGHQSEFTRTPKYGIQSKTQAWKKSRYTPLKSALPFIELAFAAYFSYFLAFAIIHQQWLSVLSLSYFRAASLMWRSARWRNGCRRCGSPGVIPARHLQDSFSAPGAQSVIASRHAGCYLQTRHASCPRNCLLLPPFCQCCCPCCCRQHTDAQPYGNNRFGARPENGRAAQLRARRAVSRLHVQVWPR